MRVLIIDDEPLAQTALANVLAPRSDIELFDSANDAIEALDKLEKNSYDLLLLDINMPEVSGLELLKRLEESGRPVPSIVFVTAHNEYAITAFEKHAVDYVLKPFSEKRIGQALDAAFRKTAGERAARLIETLPQLQQVAQRQPTRIAIKTDGRILFIDPGEVTSAHAEGNYTLLQREAGSYLLRETISTLAEKLKAYGFIRIHRSVLVNTSFVAEIRSRSTGEYELCLRSGEQYIVTRTYKKTLSALAEFWLGIDKFLAD